MSITDELREWVRDGKGSLLAIADSIDAEHEAMLEDARKYVYEGYVELPKDADGEYIRIGDVMEGKKIGGGYGEPFEVVGYVMSNGELEPMDEHRNPRKRKYSHHHHEPTIEDVMVEFATDWESAQDGEDKASVLKEYAAKLRLADDGKEQ